LRYTAAPMRAGDRVSSIPNVDRSNLVIRWCTSREDAADSPVIVDDEAKEESPRVAKAARVRSEIGETAWRMSAPSDGRATCIARSHDCRSRDQCAVATLTIVRR